MNCIVEGVYKNLRYRLLHVNKRSYIVDADRSFLVFIFPFLFWLLPQKIYLIEDQNIVNTLKSPKVKQENFKVAPFLAAGISIFIANILRYLSDYFNISTTWIINSTLISFIIIFAFYLRFLIRKISKNNINKTINIEALPTETVYIKPKSIVHILKFIIVYIFLVLLIYSMGYTFLDSGNILILLIFFLFFCVFLIVNVFTVMLANYKVTFVHKNHK